MFNLVALKGRIKLNYECEYHIQMVSELRVEYRVVGLAIAHDEVDITTDVAILEVMTALLVIERVLATDERALVELRHVAFDHERHCLPSLCSPRRYRCRVLPIHGSPVKRLLVISSSHAINFAAFHEN